MRLLPAMKSWRLTPQGAVSSIIVRPIRRPLVDESADAFLRILALQASRHDLARIGVGGRERQFGLPVESLLSKTLLPLPQ